MFFLGIVPRFPIKKKKERKKERTANTFVTRDSRHEMPSRHFLIYYYYRTGGSNSDKDLYSFLSSTLEFKSENFFLVGKFLLVVLVEIVLGVRIGELWV